LVAKHLLQRYALDQVAGNGIAGEDILPAALVEHWAAVANHSDFD
jgi:hypothetical protein